MKQLGSNGNTYYFAPRKKEDTATAIERISDIIGCGYSYIGITSPDDKQINGHQEAVDFILNKIDFNTHNLIIVTV